MLNLNELKKNNYQIVWFDGTTIELKPPKQKVLEKLIKMSQLTEEDLEKMMTLVYDLLFEVFNNNTEKREFSREEIEDNFDLETAFLVMQDYLSSIYSSLGE